MRHYRVRLKTILLSLTFFTPLPSTANESVKLQLKWSHQFQFAGYYAAQKQGYYKEAGLDVEIIEAKTGHDSTKTVLQGDAEYGVGNTSLLLSRNAGKPLVVLAVIFQHSADVLLTLQNNSAQSIHDHKNKNLIIESQTGELAAYLYHEAMPLSKFKLTSHKNKVQALINGNVDMISAYSTIEPYLLLKRNISFNIYSPRSVGIDFYGDNLFTTEEELQQHPERARKFRQASLRGWRYAMRNQEEMIDYFLEKYPNKKERNALVYEAKKMQHLILPELVEIGYTLTGRWRHIAETYASIGMLPKNISLQGFLYKPKQPKDYLLIYIISLSFLLVFLFIFVAYTRFSLFKKKLMHLLHLKSRFSNIGESVNNISHQWKQPLNELGIQLMLMEKAIENDFPTEKDKENLKDIINKSHNILEFMADTVNVFGQLLNRSDKQTTFHPKMVILALLQLVEDNFKVHRIIISSELDEEIRINGNSTELAHILLSILNNARDTFDERNITSPHIKIHLYKSSSCIYIDITDNAGGIKAQPIDKIFKLGFSSKQVNDSGVGLYIAKQLTEDKFSGKIKAENINNGAAFRICIPFPADND